MNSNNIPETLYPSENDISINQRTPTPYDRLMRMIFEDRDSLTLIFIYTFFSGLFTLAIPLATQMLVNTIAAGIFLQPLTFIAVLVLLGLTLAAALRMLTLWLVEQIRQRTFARITLRLAYRVPRIKHAALAKEYLPELVNRFFDTITVQSGWFNFLLDAPAAALQVIVGLLLLAIYSPWLVIFDLLVIGFFLCEVFLLGKRGYETRSNETTQRFIIAEWLEVLARCETELKLHGIPSYILKQTDKLLVDYVKLRRLQFNVLFSQATGLFFFQSIMSAAVLGFGGWLVIDRELTMGQLVASLLIVNIILPALERLVRNLQNIYELLSALGKIGYVEDLPLERIGGVHLLRTGGVAIRIHNLRFSYDKGQVLRGLDLSIPAGERVSLFGPNGSGKTTLACILCGLLDPNGGMVQLNGFDIRDVDLLELRNAISMVSDTNSIFHGTLIENITLGRSDINHEDILWALDMVKFEEELESLSDGLQTQLVNGGRNLSRGQIQKLLLARAIVVRPDLLILDEAFTGIEERSKVQILDNIYLPELPWTIIDISHDADTLLRCSQVFVLANGKIVETGSPAELINKSGGEMAALFPQLIALLKGNTGRK
jgi:ATP-binding cassette subfamily B protein